MTPSVRDAAAPAIKLQHIDKSYGEVQALKGISLTILDNEFFTLLGPSGCGKTTLLRILAGFEEVNAGELFLYGKPLTHEPPHKRPINTVFQQYALFPHMSVLDNVAFGLRMLGKAEAAAKKRAADMLALVRLDELAGRFPQQLSGGQQQRVAVARALAPQPEVLLLDESLSALDLKLRQAMRLELKQLQRETGITFVFVTHDQDEALTMSDRIAVMSHGEVQQIGSPQEIYDRPVNCFVADFIGETNLLRGEARRLDDGRNAFILDGGHCLPLPADIAVHEVRAVSLRPEKIRFAESGAAATVCATVTDNLYAGAASQTTVRLPNSEVALTVREAGGSGRAIGSRVNLHIAAAAVHPLKDE